MSWEDILKGKGINKSELWFEEFNKGSIGYEIESNAQKHILDKYNLTPVDDNHDYVLNFADWYDSIGDVDDFSLDRPWFLESVNSETGKKLIPLIPKFIKEDIDDTWEDRWE